MKLSPVDRIPARVPLAATLPDGTPATLTDVALAVLPAYAKPRAGTTWQAVALVDGAAPLMLAGPEADPIGALVVPAGGGTLFVRVIDGDVVQVRKVAALTVGV
jgi:hypothetical protein